MNDEIGIVRSLIGKDTGEELGLALDFILNEELIEKYMKYRADYYHDKNMPLELTFSEDFLKELEEND